MKSLRLLLFFAAVFLILTSSGQVPQLIDYQGMARDGSGIPIINTTISTRMSVYEGPLPGIMQYSELHNPTTDSYGLFHFMIGDGSPISGDFTSINWSTGNYFIQTEIDLAGGAAFVDMGMSKMTTVPYAFYADSSGRSSLPWVTNSNNIYYINGNVGIGLLDPMVNLQVKEENSSGALGSNIGVMYSPSQLLAPAVLGWSENNTAEITSGVLGHAYSTSSWYNEGVFGEGGGGSINNYGVYGVAMGDAGSAYSVAIYGDDMGAGTNNYAGYFDGDVHVMGILSKSGGSFKIDHPLDPTNKFLVHSFVESPDMKNIYDGNVTTDAKGYAIVELPSYFDALNVDFRYQLTVIGEFADAIVKEEISENHFTIQTDKPNVKVSWQVTGIRNDLWAQENRIQAEVEKQDVEKGLYLHPELYGKSSEMGMKTGIPRVERH